MKRSNKSGFTLVELLVVITIIGTLMGLLLPAVQQAREAARGLTCSNHINQIGKGLLLYEQNFKQFPGYVESFGNDPQQATRQWRGSWVVAIFPFIDEQNVYDRWKDHHDPVSPSIALLNCPSDPPDFTDSPTLSYVVNTGRSPGDSSSPQQPSTFEQLADGMFFDRSCNALNGQRGAPQPPDPRQSGNGCTMLEMSSRYLDSHDGNSRTMMVSENVHTLFYIYYDQFQERYERRIADDKQYFGFVWSNSPAPIERVNGDNDAVIELMSNLDYSHAWPSSRHPGYVNRAFGDGHVNKMLETIDPVVYRQLMTTRDKASTNITKGSLSNEDTL